MIVPHSQVEGTSYRKVAPEGGCNCTVRIRLVKHDTYENFFQQNVYHSNKVSNTIQTPSKRRLYRLRKEPTPLANEILTTLRHIFLPINNSKAT